MPARKKSGPAPWYAVLVFAYVDEASKAEGTVTFEAINATSFYSGYSYPKARVALGHAVIAASRNPLAFAVHLRRDNEPIVKVRVEH